MQRACHRICGAGGDVGQPQAAQQRSQLCRARLGACCCCRSGLQQAVEALVENAVTSHTHNACREESQPGRRMAKFGWHTGKVQEQQGPLLWLER